MAIFSAKKNKDAKATAPAAKSASVKPAKKAKVAKAASKEVALPKVDSDSAIVSNHADVILRPRITEKSGLLSQGGVYTFEVTKNANKEAIRKAVASLYKVIPVKIAVLNHPARSVFVKGRKGVVSGLRKAVVTLKKGEKIDFV